ncbi:uncharacterized protein LOC110443095 isoform X2 [Mizuhopecten yessoensis]|uniref:uncharacterized protein LOC110443095 isoform X2 n=1 Tax=Mizuhopecten yessoensis TaxID=6573 RepID=UPI000B4594B0|nr:uncharacterized protein LOC110443095 isoform X2 [Mizuhopecten yessoensis]
MSGGTQMEAGQLLKCGEGEFEKSIQEMSLKNLLDTISILQKEMSREQASFNSQSAQLATLNKNSRQYKQISKEMNTSQTRLTMLMNRSMKCFQQQGNQHVKAAASSPPGVQRHNSNVVPKEGVQGTSVQRRHSSKVSATDGEVIKSGFDTKVSTQNTGPKKPVILQPIVNTSRMPGMGVANSKVTTTNGVSETSTVSTSVSSISVKSDSKSTDPCPAHSNIVTSTASVPVSSLTNGTSSTVGSSSTKSSGITSTNTAPVSSSSNGKRTSILNFGVKNTVQNLERKSVVNVSTSQVVTNGTGTRSTTSSTSRVVVKPVSVKGKTIVSTASAVSKPVVSSVVTKPATTAVVTQQATTAVVTKPVPSGVVTKTVTSSIQVSSEATKKIPDAPVVPVMKKVSQPSKYSRPPINEPVDPREQMLNAIRSFKRPADAPKVEPIRKAQATEVKLNITQGKPAQPQKEVPTTLPQQKVVPVSVQQQKTAPFSIPQQNVVPATVKQQTVAAVSVKTSEKPKEPEKKEKETVILESKSVEDKTVGAEPIKPIDSMVTKDKLKVTQPTAKVTDDNEELSVTQGPSQTTTEDEAESEEDRPEEKFVSSVTFTHKPSKPTEIVKPKTKVQAPSLAVSSVVAPSPASVPVPTEPKQVDARYEMHISDEENRGLAIDEDEDDEVLPTRINLRDWNPTKLLCDLYTVKLAKEEVEDVSDKFVGMEGLMEKLPMNKKKATLLKTWKRRFFRAKDGWLHYFETNNRDRPSDSVQLMGGRVDDLGNRILGIDDGRGRYLMVRCPTDTEYGQWKLALESQTVDNVGATYVRPVLKSPPNPRRKVVLIDIGSCSIRAGILGQEATVPEVFFPSMVARNKDSGEIHIGTKAYHPDIRKTSALMKAVRPTSKMDKDHMKAFNVDTEVMPAVLQKIFTDLNIDPSKYWIMMSTPQNLADQLKAALFEILVGQFQVKGVCMVMQSLLALYSYQKTSGILVDIGQRMEILPICDGYVIEGGVSRQSYGGQKVEDCLNNSLTENKYVFVTPVEQLIVRHIMEQSCYVAEDYDDREKKCVSDPESCQSTVFLDKYDLPEGSHRTVTHDRSCYHSPEGFFNTDLWGMDYPCVHNLVFKAIQFCPIDSRKHMYRAIYLSGGVTMMPGFAERLQKELIKLAPPSVIVEVHASPHRYHAAYIGACSLANMDMFEQSCITGNEWARNGVKAFAKWAMQSS